MSDSRVVTDVPAHPAVCRVYSVPEAAPIIGISPTTLYDLLRKGELAELGARKIGRQWKISHANIARYLGEAS